MQTSGVLYTVCCVSRPLFSEADALPVLFSPGRTLSSRDGVQPGLGCRCTLSLHNSPLPHRDGDRDMPKGQVAECVVWQPWPPGLGVELPLRQR